MRNMGQQGTGLLCNFNSFPSGTIDWNAVVTGLLYYSKFEPIRHIIIVGSPPFDSNPAFIEMKRIENAVLHIAGKIETQPHKSDEDLLIDAYKRFISGSDSVRNLLVFSGDGNFLRLFDFLESRIDSAVVICLQENFSKYFGADKFSIRYPADLVRFPENWWHPDTSPLSPQKIADILREIDDATVATQDIRPLLKNLHHALEIVKIATLKALKQRLWNSVQVKQFQKLKDALLPEIMAFHERAIAEKNTKLVEVLHDNVLTTIKNIELGKVVHLGRHKGDKTFDQIVASFQSEDNDLRRAAVIAFWELGDLRALEYLEPYIAKVAGKIGRLQVQDKPIPEILLEEIEFLREKIDDIRENQTPSYDNRRIK